MTEAKDLFATPPLPAQGAFIRSDGSTHWCVWAPNANAVKLILKNGASSSNRAIEMTSSGNGFFEHTSPETMAETRYAYQLDGGPPRPDPASRWQPEGVNTFSAIFDPEEYRWSDADWKGIARNDIVIYELHVGTFTKRGSFEAVIPKMNELRTLGITAIELMPISQFSGGRNWGYDGVHPFAVQNTYGGPAGLQHLVDAAHSYGIGIILDVVYNHVGPEGNYLPEFGPYFTSRYHTPWGSALNFDGPDCDPVRDFICDNARMWIRDFHVDGIRLDAIQTIYDFSARHILEAVREAVHDEGASQQRMVHVIGETNQNDARLTESPNRGGIGLDAVWSDDLHHCIHTVMTEEEDGYYQDFGTLDHLVKAFNETFVYDGKYSPHRRRRFGSSVVNQDPTRFVVCIQNHDQVGNRALGERLDALVTPGQRRLAVALLMLAPGIPLLFMGEEYGETRPFQFFCSFNEPELVDAVRRGRNEEFSDFEFGSQEAVPDPQAEATFLRSQLTWSCPAGSNREGLFRLYRDLLAARRDWPALLDRRHTKARLLDISMSAAEEHGEVARGKGVLEVQRGFDPCMTAFANFSQRCIPLASLVNDEPVDILLATEDVQYGGTRPVEGSWDKILPDEAVILNTSENGHSDRPRQVTLHERQRNQRTARPTC